MKKSLLTATVAVMTFLSSTAVHAWGHQGHALVAEVAFHYMDEATKKNVLQYLDGMSIEEAANWMDAIKSDHANDYMKPYHYINLEKGSKEVPTGDNIVTILNSTLKDLDHKENLSHDEIKRRILIIFHLIGDLHQPLHIGYFSDKGGNSIKLNFIGGKETNLHSTWDSDIIEFKGTSLADVLKSKKYTSEAIEGMQKIDVIGWAKQSRGYLKQVYEVKNNKVEETYIDAVYPIIETQLLDGGIRLAAILEHYFKVNS
jgi:hypothetical protein